MDSLNALAVYMRENCDQSLPLHVLGERVALSPFTLQRKFKQRFGVSPRQFQEHCRMERLKEQLAKCPEVTGAIYEAGFGSPSRVYEKAAKQFGMTPKEYGRRGRNMDITYIQFPTCIGQVLLAATKRGVCAVRIGTEADPLVNELVQEFPQANLHFVPEPYPPELEQWRCLLLGYLSGKASLDEIHLDIRATAFQSLVWRFLQTIPRGETRSYQEVAAGIGAPNATRAVARACATNPIALLIPCHRVIRQSGELAGYRWGLDRKRKLLEMERQSR